MKIVKIKVREAQGPVLDWLVAKCEGALSPLGNVILKGNQRLIIACGDIETPTVIYSPSTDGAQGVPIIERKKYSFRFDSGCSGDIENNWTVQQGEAPFELFHGETLLLAAMRCCVGSAMGEEVEVPVELLK